MIKKLLIFSSLCSTALITACTVTSAPMGPMKNKIYQSKLANGRAIRYGYQKPDASWRCQTVKEQRYNWAMQQFKGTLNLGGGYDRLAQTAIQYINQNGLRTNYFYMFIPTQVDVMAINVTMMRKAEVIYYQCQFLPQ